MTRMRRVSLGAATVALVSAWAAACALPGFNKVTDLGDASSDTAGGDVADAGAAEVGDGATCGAGVVHLTGGSVAAPALDAYNAASLTVEAWVRESPASQGVNRNIVHHFGHYGDAGTASYALFKNSQEHPAFAISCDGGDFQPLAATLPLVPDRWTHLAGTFDATDSRTRIYVDGVLAGESSTLQCTRPHPVSGIDLVVAYNDTSGGGPLLGDIDEVRVSSVVRYTPATSPFSPAPVFPDQEAQTLALFHFDAPSSHDLVAFDSSQRANNGALQGNALLTTTCRP